LKINVPTGKDSLSLSQQYPDGEKIISPGTVIVSAGGEVSDVSKVVSPRHVNIERHYLIHIDFSFDSNCGWAARLRQSLEQGGQRRPYVKKAATSAPPSTPCSRLIGEGIVLAGHDISAGGLITCLLEMCFANTEGGLEIGLDNFKQDIVKILFAENPGVVFR
jgi:phosphoribosylformylglycinamidine synthase